MYVCMYACMYIRIYVYRGIEHLPRALDSSDAERCSEHSGFVTRTKLKLTCHAPLRAAMLCVPKFVFATISWRFSEQSGLVSRPNFRAAMLCVPWFVFATISCYKVTVK
jgi:hypothetical protein